MDCEYPIDIKCDRNHEYSRPCCKKSAPCGVCADDDFKKERKRKRDLDLETKRLSNQRTYERKLQEIQDEIEHEQRLQNEMLEGKERDKILEQRRRDLQSVKEIGLKMTSFSIQSSSTENKRQDETSAFTDQDSSKNGVQQKRGSNPNGADQTAEDEWIYQKKYEGAENEAIDSLMAMIGLEDVKQKFLSIKSKVDTAIRQCVDLKDERFGATLLGNPGTGKPPSSSRRLINSS